VLEALAALVDHAFTTMALRRLEAKVDVRNVASIALLRRLGFTKEGVLREYAVSKGDVRTLEISGLLKKEWQQASIE
jgi:ribosomal-protein-alanine N-acetyltransferase